MDKANPRHKALDMALQMPLREAEAANYDFFLNLPEVDRTLARLRDASAARENVMPPLVEAVRAYATIGEISDVWRDVYGIYEEPPII